jgi:SAM-dependent methyltransferase
MIAETLVRSGHALVRPYPPEGRDYWSVRFWDRADVESHHVLGQDFLAQKTQVAELLTRHGGDARTVLEFACGTGEFTAMAASLTTATSVVATDISQHALDVAGSRVKQPQVRFVRGDFWADDGLVQADLVMCMDAIHHLGDVRSVLERLRSFVAPGGIFVGNLWTLDNFHEYQRQRYGAFGHLGRASKFFATAVAMRLTGGRLRTPAYRTQLLRRAAIAPLLSEVFSETVELESTRHFTCFVCRP